MPINTAPPPSPEEEDCPHWLCASEEYCASQNRKQKRYYQEDTAFFDTAYPNCEQCGCVTTTSSTTTTTTSSSTTTEEPEIECCICYTSGSWGCSEEEIALCENMGGVHIPQTDPELMSCGCEILYFKEPCSDNPNPNQLTTTKAPYNCNGQFDRVMIKQSECQ